MLKAAEGTDSNVKGSKRQRCQEGSQTHTCWGPHLVSPTTLLQTAYTCWCGLPTAWPATLGNSEARSVMTECRSTCNNSARLRHLQWLFMLLLLLTIRILVMLGSGTASSEQAYATTGPLLPRYALLLSITDNAAIHVVQPSTLMHCRTQQWSMA